jgi:NDP-sugar pyrophosphorylase family protein
MQCVILVGGLGTRLGSLTSDCPKPMLQVGGRPFVEQLIRNAARFGFTKFLLLAGHRGEVVAAHFADGTIHTPSGKVRVEVVIESEPRGTGGALAFAANRLAPHFLMLNGDSLFRFNLLDLVTRPGFEKRLGRLALRRVPDATRYGVVKIARDGQITAMRERPPEPGAGEINGGVYWLDRRILELIPAEGFVSLEREVFPAAIARGALDACRYEGAFLDIGVPDDYAAACDMDFERRPAVFFDRDGVLNHDAGYMHRVDDLHWIDGAIEAVRCVNDADL